MRSVLVCVLFSSIVFVRYAQPQDRISASLTNSNYLSKVHQGDLVDIHIQGFIEYDWRGRLNPEGYFDGFDRLPNPIYAQCRSIDDIAADISKGFAAILRDPKAEVRIIDSSKRAFAVLDGAVKVPQRFQIRRPIRLNEMIIHSGGLTERSSGEILVTRPNGLSCFEEPIDKASRTFTIRIADLLAGDAKSNPMIVSGDLVVVSEALPVYLLGAVGTQGKLDFRADLTLSRAIDSAGGTTKQGVLDRVNIYRRGGDSSVISVDLNKIRANELEDVKLRPFDIIDVPFKGRPPKRLPPVIEDLDNENERRSKLPVKIIE